VQERTRSVVDEINLYPRRYKHLGGWLCLNFCNTHARYLKEGPDERLLSYLHLVSWALQMDMLDEREARRLLREAEGRSAEASAVVEAARTLREVLYRVFSALAHARQPEPGDFAALNVALRQALTHAALVPTAAGYAWGWIDQQAALDWMLWPVLRSAADLLVMDELSRLRQCEGTGCGFLFLDKSKNRNRRWCETDLCGNRARVRKHYQRSKVAHAGEPMNFDE
jgi:predicted RNA-binding Zn ribbon-like protein